MGMKRQEGEKRYFSLIVKWHLKWESGYLSNAAFIREKKYSFEEINMHVAFGVEILEISAGYQTMG